jgi:hypothetical protein
MTTMAWTTVQREPRVAAEAAERQDLILERRDAGNLVLGTEVRRRRQAVVLVLAGHLLRGWAEQEPMEQALNDEFPWLIELPEDQRALFRAELVATMLSAAELEQPERIADLVADWKATAAVWADPLLREQLRGALVGGYGEPVAPPDPA